MGRVGRNKPCPCGSGRKYKRCCLARDEKAGAKSASDVPPPRQEIPSRNAALPDLRPYALARMIEDTPTLRNMRVHDPERWAMCSFEGVEGLSIQDIQDRLAEWGFDASREGFLASAAGETSAWDVSVKWIAGRPERSFAPEAEDFAGLAACRLWKEFLPERPSIEMVHDWMGEGYDEEVERPERACELWWRVWEDLRGRLTPEMRSRGDADRMYQGMQSIFNWTQDFELALYNASLRDPAQAERGIGFFRDLLERFPEDTWLLRTNTRCDLGEILFRAGRAAEGEETLRAVIGEYPDRAAGYVRLADVLGKTNKRQALALLEGARDQPVRDGHDYSLEERIQDLEEELRKEGNA